MERLNWLSKIKVLTLSPFLLLHVLVGYSCKNHHLIKADIDAWRLYRPWVSQRNFFWSLCSLLVLQHDFRMQYKLRIGRWSKFLPLPNSCMGDLGQCPNIGGGLCIIHGFGTVINGSAVIGRNCTILQGVTVGGGKGGSPIIGDNVYIGAGAIIIGKITVGDNVKIGAGAIVVKDIPSNCTVVSEKSRVIQH